MKVIVHKLRAGNVVITTPVEITAEEFISNHLPSDEPYILMDADKIPNGKYISSFDIVDGKITIDMAKAKEVHKEDLRFKRIEAFKPLDVEFMRAVEQGDTAKQQEIGAKKQALRDVTSSSAFDTAETLDDLEKITLPV